MNRTKKGNTGYFDFDFELKCDECNKVIKLLDKYYIEKSSLEKKKHKILCNKCLHIYEDISKNININ